MTRVLSALMLVIGLVLIVRTISLGPEQKSPAHLAMQPFGQAPAIEENGLVLFESGAIALYIAKQSGRNRVEAAKVFSQRCGEVTSPSWSR